MKKTTLILHKFEEKDFEGAGQYLVRTTDAHVEETGYLSTILYKVGYCHDKKPKLENGGYNLISMADGWTNGDYTKKELVEALNGRSLDQRMRFATKLEVLRVIEYQSSRWIEDL